MSAIPDTMQALVLKYDGYSGTAEGPTIEDLKDWVSLEEIAVPKPEGRQVLVRIGLANINPSDLHYIKGEYGQPRRKGVAAGFEAMGKVVHCGPIGTGTRFKLARNLMHFVAFTAATEAQRLAEAAGLDLRALGDVVRHTDTITGGPGAIMHRETTAPIAPDDFWFGVFEHVVALGEKDLTFALSLADELGVDTPLARLALDRLAPGLGMPHSALHPTSTPTEEHP